MKKHITKIICILAMLLVTSGCSKEVLNTNTFAAILKNNGFNLIDLTEQYKNQNHINKVIIGKNNNEYQIEYYLLKDIETAKSLYNKNVNNISKLNVSTTKQTKLEGNNYLKYTLVTTDNYYVIMQLDNTLIYIESSIDYEDEINEILKEMKY